jgi:ketosteroid isomerase-like protein
MPSAPAVQSREALLQMAKAMQPMSSVSMTTQRIEGSGNIAYIYGEGSSVNGRPPNTGATTHVRGVIVWRKEADGRWRVVQGMLNAMPAVM